MCGNYTIVNAFCYTTIIYPRLITRMVALINTNYIILDAFLHHDKISKLNNTHRYLKYILTKQF